MRISAFEAAKEKIEKYFNKLPRKAFTIKALEIIFNDQQSNWKIPESKKSFNFIAFLKQKEFLLTWKFYHGESNNEVIIHSWKTSDLLTVISGLKNRAYFTHYSAMFIHGLTEQVPKTYYLNLEHSGPMQTRNSILTQESIDGAFSKEQRKSGEQFRFNLLNIILLNGQHTGRLGVVDKIEREINYSYTDLHRTLIDIAIRPAYAGGVFEVLKAYENAKSSFNPSLLKKYLDELNFIYPYNRVIGFYLDKAGYPESTLTLFKEKMDLNFYLTYKMKNPQFDSKWKLFYPRGLEL
jgi:hypothetical protein